MSHLGRRLSALIDGELSDTERDQVHAHLVGCDDCRAEAAALRTIKRRVRGLGETPADGTLTSRLIALAALGEPAPPHPRFPTAPRTRSPITALTGGNPAARPSAWCDVPEWPGGEPVGGGADMEPLASPASRSRGHARYVVAGAVAALAVGLGAASFAAGGGDQMQGPRVIPEVDMYSFEHAVNTGGLPLFQPRERFPVKKTSVSATP